MPKAIDHTGKKFGRLTVLGLAGKSGNDRKCLVRCDCGTEKEVVQSKLTAKTKPTRSCGCLAKLNHYATHRATSHKWYHIWKSMLARCCRPAQKSYPIYGGRGINVCKEWKEDPWIFFLWLEKNGYKKGLQIDRMDNNSGYCPENCRVVTPKQNCANRQNSRKFNVDGELLTISQISEKVGIKRATLYKRLIIMKWELKQAMTLPLWHRAQPERREDSVKNN